MIDTIPKKVYWAAGPQLVDGEELSASAWQQAALQQLALKGYED